MDNFKKNHEGTSTHNNGLSWHEAKRLEREIIQGRLNNHGNHQHRLYGFHAWEGKPQGANAQRYNDVLLDVSTYSPALVAKLTERGVSVIFLGHDSKFTAVMSYVLANNGIVLVTKNKDLDGQLPHAKSLYLENYKNFEEVSKTVILFAKELPQVLSAPTIPEPKSNPVVPKKVIPPTWHGDIPYCESEITGANVVVSSGKAGHTPSMVNEDTVDYSSIIVPSIVKLTNGAVELSRTEMEGVWDAKTVTASKHNAKIFIRDPAGTIVSIGAGPTDPVSRALDGKDGVYTISLDKSINYLRFLRERIGGENMQHGYIVADSMHLPFRGESVDTAASTYLFEKLNGKALALSLLEARRISKRNLYLELAPSQGNKKFESVRFLMELCGFNNTKSLRHRVSFSNGNSAQSYIFTADSKGNLFKGELIRKACDLGTPSNCSDDVIKMERMLTADYQRYRNMNRYFMTVAENIHALIDRMYELGDATDKFTFNLILSAKGRSSFTVRFNPVAKGAPERIDAEKLKKELEIHKVEHTIIPAHKGAITVNIIKVPEHTIWLMELIRTAPAKLMDAAKAVAMESIYNGIDTEERMQLLDTRGYWGED
ncbi:MAG TPA: methyltransferase domain-containing protein [Candidatus Acidoferrales bacterium]|nr:methyltransferase domain-containing protein [Candidatus Acidoferrales bacterium]